MSHHRKTSLVFILSSIGMHSRCVVSRLCVPNREYQSVNPTTQVALFALCVPDCVSMINVTWNVYRGTMNSTSNSVQWAPFPQQSSYEDRWFFGNPSIPLLFIVISRSFVSVQGLILVTSLQSINCSWRILQLLTGASKCSTRFHQRRVRVP